MNAASINLDGLIKSDPKVLSKLISLFTPSGSQELDLGLMGATYITYLRQKNTTTWTREERRMFSLASKITSGTEWEKTVFPDSTSESDKKFLKDMDQAYQEWREAVKHG